MEIGLGPVCVCTVRLVTVRLCGGAVGQLGKVWVGVEPLTMLSTGLRRQSNSRTEARLDETVHFHAVGSKVGEEAPW